MADENCAWPIYIPAPGCHDGNGPHPTVPATERDMEVRGFVRASRLAAAEAMVEDAKKLAAWSESDAGMMPNEVREAVKRILASSPSEQAGGEGAFMVDRASYDKGVYDAMHGGVPNYSCGYPNCDRCPSEKQLCATCKSPECPRSVLGPDSYCDGYKRKPSEQASKEDSGQCKVCGRPRGGASGYCDGGAGPIGDAECCRIGYLRLETQLAEAKASLVHQEKVSETYLITIHASGMNATS